MQNGLAAARARRKPALALVAIFGCCWLGAGQSIPPWFPKAPPLPPPRGEVIRVATVEALLSAIDRLPADRVIVLADGHYKLPRPMVLDYKTNVVLRSASGYPAKVTLTGRGWETGDKYDDILHIAHCDGVTIADVSFSDCRSYGIKVFSNTIWRPERNWNQGIRIGTGTTQTEIADNLVHGGIVSAGGDAQLHDGFHRTMLSQSQELVSFVKTHANP